MPLDGMVVVDCVTHAFDNRPSNAQDARYALPVVEGNFQFQWEWTPDPYRLTREEYFDAMSPETLTSALFLESDTDIAFYHTIPAWGVFGDFSPISVAMDIRARYPGRMHIYGAASPLEGSKAIDDIEQQSAEWDIRGIKLYPVDVVDGEMRHFSLADEDLVYPVLQRCQDLGITNVAVHKAIPLGSAPSDAFRVNDIDYAARDFPEINFQIVHGGFAFLDETRFLLGRFPNVFVDLEATSLLLLRRPRAFVEILGELLSWGGTDKVFWSSGCSAHHPQPLLEAFSKLEMPEDLIEGRGYPRLTREIKEQILGKSFAKLHGLDLAEEMAKIDDDELAKRRRRGHLSPWNNIRGAGV